MPKLLFDKKPIINVAIITAAVAIPFFFAPFFANPIPRITWFKYLSAALIVWAFWFRFFKWFEYGFVAFLLWAFWFTFQDSLPGDHHFFKYILRVFVVFAAILQISKSIAKVQNNEKIN